MPVETIKPGVSGSALLKGAVGTPLRIAGKVFSGMGKSVKQKAKAKITAKQKDADTLKKEFVKGASKELKIKQNTREAVNKEHIKSMGRDVKAQQSARDLQKMHDIKNASREAHLKQNVDQAQKMHDIKSESKIKTAAGVEAEKRDTAMAKQQARTIGKAERMQLNKVKGPRKTPAAKPAFKPKPIGKETKHAMFGDLELFNDIPYMSGECKVIHDDK